jgi:hypothetical protein
LSRIQAFTSRDQAFNSDDEKKAVRNRKLATVWFLTNLMKVACFRKP